VLEWIEDHAYNLELQGDMNVSATFNVGDPVPYVEGDFEDLKANPSKEVEIDKYQV